MLGGRSARSLARPGPVGEGSVARMRRVAAGRLGGPASSRPAARQACGALGGLARIGSFAVCGRTLSGPGPGPASIIPPVFSVFRHGLRVLRACSLDRTVWGAPFPEPTHTSGALGFSKFSISSGTGRRAVAAGRMRRWPERSRVASARVGDGKGSRVPASSYPAREDRSRLAMGRRPRHLPGPETTRKRGQQECRQVQVRERSKGRREGLAKFRLDRRKPRAGMSFCVDRWTLVTFRRSNMGHKILELVIKN